MSLDWLPGLDLSTGTFTLPLWAVGIALALFVALIVIAVVRSGMSEFGSIVYRAAVILIAVVFGWTYISRTGERDRLAERHVLDQRRADLVGRAIAPGSVVACLEATNTETVEGSCERSVFATPENVAAATTYMAARISLLADAHEYTSKRDQSYESQVAGLRRTVAADRFGLASQVLAVRDGCTADACDTFGHVYDDKKLKANLRDRTFDVTLARYASNWPARASRPLASSGQSGNAFGPPAAAFPPAQSGPSASAEPAPNLFSAPPPPQAADTPPPTQSAPASATKRAPSPPPPAAARKAAAPPASAPLSLTAPKQ
jgi:hypothetical protein